MHVRYMIRDLSNLAASVLTAKDYEEGVKRLYVYSYKYTLPIYVYTLLVYVYTIYIYYCYILKYIILVYIYFLYICIIGIRSM